MNPDIHQEIYGMPEYMGALLSASLSHSADKFRKLYYDNGSHAGCILYVGSEKVDQESIKVVQRRCHRPEGKAPSKTC
jgi:capsid portal protein